jgi:hypothetical protein
VLRIHPAGRSPDAPVLRIHPAGRSPDAEEEEEEDEDTAERVAICGKTMEQEPARLQGGMGERDLDIANLPVIDNHCHLFDVEYQERNLARTLSLSLNDMPLDQLANTLVYRKMLKELGDFLGVHGRDEDILARREHLMRTSYSQYVGSLFEDARIHTLLVDLGYQPERTPHSCRPGASPEAEAVGLAEFEELAPARVKYLYRIETVLDEIWKQGLGLAAAEEKFYQSLDDAISRGIVGIKSIIGYRTGLDIQERPRSDLKKNIKDEKEFRDYFLLRAIEKAIELGLPLQVHAAFGESNINLLNNNPLLLKGLLDNPKYNKIAIILVHGGYPYSFEAGYLAAMYPGVYLDISEMVPFVPLGSSQGIRNMIDMCPLNKIMYGSDGFALPDLHWLGARVAKQEIAAILAELIALGLQDQDLALATAGNIFFDTARKVYNL